MPGISTDRTAAVAQLLERLFSDRELFNFVRHLTLEDMSSVEDPEGDNFVTSVVQALERRGLIDDRFFELLIEERPRLAQLIKEVQARTLHSGWRYDFLILHTSEDQKDAEKLQTMLSGEVVLASDADRDLIGEEWESWIYRLFESSRVVVALVTPRWSTSSAARAIRKSWTRSEAEAAIRVVRTQYFVPVLLGVRRAELASDPIFGVLADPTALAVGGRNALPLVANLLSNLLIQPPTNDSRTQDQALHELTTRFMRAADRKPRVRGPGEMEVPDPLLVASETPASSTDVKALVRLLRSAQAGYLVHKGALTKDTVAEIDKVRTEGKTIIPLSENTMKAALADDTAKSILRQLDTTYRSKDNLFDTLSAVIDERFFFGRNDLLLEVSAALTRSEHALVFGLRKCGKTSFLNIIRQRLSKHPFCVIDLERYDKEAEDWPPLFFRQIVDSFDQWGRAEYSDWPTETENVASGSDLDAALRKRRRWQSDRGREANRVIVMLDEMERVLPRDGDESTARKYIRAAGALRALAQSKDGFVSLIVSDLRPRANRQNQMGPAGTNPLFSFFHEVPLPLLNLAELADMVASIGSAMGLISPQQAFIDKLYEGSGGHPFLSRVVAGAAYKNRGKASDTSLTAKSLDRGIGALHDQDVLGTFFRENLWGGLTDREKEILGDAVQKSGKRSTGPEAAFLSAIGLLKEGKPAIGLFSQWIKDTV